MATAINAVSFTQRKRSVLIGRRLRALAIVVVLGSIVVASGHLRTAHDAVANASDISAAPASMATDADYFPSHFAPPTGEPAERVATF